jgi:hypothetical protein
VVENEALHLAAHGIEKGTAVFAGNVSFLLQALEILADGRLGDLEG